MHESLQVQCIGIGSTLTSIVCARSSVQDSSCISSATLVNEDSYKGEGGGRGRRGEGGGGGGEGGREGEGRVIATTTAL